MEVIGHREAPGRPALFATTKQFLDDLGLASLDQLPLLDSMTQSNDVFAGLAESLDAPSNGGELQLDMVLDAASPNMDPV